MRIDDTRHLGRPGASSTWIVDVDFSLGLEMILFLILLQISKGLWLRLHQGVLPSMSHQDASLWLSASPVMIVVECITSLKSNHEDTCVLLWKRVSSPSFEKAKNNSASMTSHFDEGFNPRKMQRSDFETLLVRSLYRGGSRSGLVHTQLAISTAFGNRKDLPSAIHSQIDSHTH
jgi:hypothetical protein